MANQEHLHKFRNSEEEQWNQWRKENPTIRPDLSGGDFSIEEAHQEALNRSLMGLASLKEKVIDPAEAKVKELLERKIKLLSSS